MFEVPAAQLAREQVVVAEQVVAAHAAVFAKELVVIEPAWVVLPALQVQALVALDLRQEVLPNLADKFQRVVDFGVEL